jgi:hypothetical protein
MTRLPVYVTGITIVGLLTPFIILVNKDGPGYYLILSKILLSGALNKVHNFIRITNVL